ncbi:dystrophin-like [Onthophagus taurus]|uniref:dystrophin-like n=1 Tax=Onthophagus taurus TaxID=166361 RepID=UPI0039BE7395
MNSPWRKFEDEKGFPYYIHEQSKVKQWDHPKFLEIKEKLDECNWIKYAAYRVAFKIRFLQQSLYMDIIPLNLISGIFERHQLNSTENTLRLESYDIEAILSDIYFAVNKQNNLNIDIDLIVELMQNFLYNVCDKNREGLVQVIHLKLVLSLMCNSNVNNFFHYLFNLCADHNNCITRLKVQTILSKISDIISYLHEDLNFGHHLINSSVEECFAKSPGLVGINESIFINWLENNPQILIWLPTLHRLKKSESAVHNAKCSFCKISPIVGLKYRCVKCSRYIQCQKCYLTARVNRMHKITHNMKEYCIEDNTKEVNHGLVKKLCSLLRCSTQGNNSTIIETNPISIDKDWLSRLQSDSGNNGDIDPVSSPHLQLQLIIKQLESQNKELQQLLHLEMSPGKDLKDYLENHRVNVAAQIQKLKTLNNHLKDSHPDPKPQHKISIESTPMVPNYKSRIMIDTLSPITISKSFENLDKQNDLFKSKSNYVVEQSSSMNPTLTDLSTWIGGKPSIMNEPSIRSDYKTPVYEMHNDLDEALAKLQQILANNFTLDESLGSIDNGELKNAVTEVEGMLTSLIDNVESTRCNSVQPHVFGKNDSEVYEPKFKYC